MKAISREPAPERSVEKARPDLSSQERLVLRWLLRYPLLRVADLTFLCSEISRASLYWCLARMAEDGWVEVLFSAALGKQSAAWYYLSNRGVRVIAADLGRDPVALARAYGADERGLQRLLPRLSQLVVVQEFLADLCCSAPQHLTYQGQRSAIAWHWLRDYQYQVQVKPRQTAFTVDALLVLRMRPELPRYPDASRQEQTEQQARAHERWYRLQVILDSPLLDAAQIRSRLKLLCLARDQLTPASFPATLILLSAPEREALWRACMRRLTETDQLASLAAALGVYQPFVQHVPAQKGQVWRLPWQRLSPKAPCHLKELLVPQASEDVATALLASLEMVEQEAHQLVATQPSAPLQASTSRELALAANTTTERLPVTSRRRLRCIVRGHFAERVACEDPLPLPLACTTLSKRQITLLMRIELCPFASTEEIAVWEALQLASARRYLGQLKQSGWVRSARELLQEEIAIHTQRWVLSEQGIRGLARIAHLPWKRQTLALKLPTDPSTTGQEEVCIPRRAAAILQHRTTAQVLGLYEFFTELSQAATEQRADRLCWWSRELGQRTYEWNGTTYQFHPDALAEYESGERHIRFWLEYEAGDPAVRDLMTTLTRYSTYLRSREWMRELTPLPVLCYLVQGPAQERRLARVAARLPGGFAGGRLAVTTTSRVQQVGILKPIWWRLLPEMESNEHDLSPQRITLLEL